MDLEILKKLKHYLKQFNCILSMKQLDEDFTYIYANDTMKQVFGYLNYFDKCNDFDIFSKDEAMSIRRNDIIVKIQNIKHVGRTQFINDNRLLVIHFIKAVVYLVDGSKCILTAGFSPLLLSCDINEINKNYLHYIFDKIPKEVLDPNRNQHLNFLAFRDDLTKLVENYEALQNDKYLLNQQNKMIHYQNITNRCVREIIQLIDFDCAANHILMLLGKVTEAQRSFIFIVDGQNLHYKYEWSLNAQDQQIDIVKNVSLKLIPKWMEKLYRKEPVIIENSSNLSSDWAAEKELLELQNIKSVLVQGIWIEDKLWGFIGLDYLNDYKDFDNCDLFLIQNAINTLLLGLENAKKREELEAINKELMTATKLAKDALKAKSLFITTMSHEIRTPLNAIIGFSELLLEDNASKCEEKEYIASINSAGLSLLGLINDILDLSKLEAGSLVLNYEVCNIVEMEKELRAIFHLQIQENEIDAQIIVPNFKTQFLIPLQALRQTLLNLLGNALKFTRNSYIRFEIGMIDETDQDATLIFSVIDNGIGISEEFKKDLFTFFSQQQTTLIQKHKGTGVGLAISYRLALAMKGSLNFADNPDGGCCFTLTLPNVKKVAHENTLKLLDTRSLSNCDNKVCDRILIVDDIELNIKVLSLMLRGYCNELKAVSSAKEALEVLETFPADIIFSDIWMPEMNGDEFVKIVKENPKFSHIKTVAVTADIEHINNEEFFDAKIYKPISKSKIKDVMLALLRMQ